MNVLYLTHRLPFAPNRGDRIRSFHMLREMSRFATVSVFSFVHDDEEEREAIDMPFTRNVRVARVPRVRNLMRCMTALPTDRPLTHAMLDAPDVRAGLASLRRDAEPDIVVAYCSGVARLALEPPLADLPFVVDMVDVDSAKWARLADEQRGPRAWVFRRESRVLRQFEAVAVARARLTLTVNRHEYDLLRQIAPSANLRVMENGIDLGAFRPLDLPAASATVVFCGVMNYAPNEAGVRWFVKDVWPLVRGRRPDARFVVVGSSPTREIRALASDAAQIEVTGRVADVQPFLWNAAVSVAPLHLARGLQNKVLEALAAGLPVVATSAVATGLPERVRPACDVADDAETFANAVTNALSLTPTFRRRRAEEAALAELSWEEQLKDLQTLIQAAARSAPSSVNAGSVRFSARS